MALYEVVLRTRYFEQLCINTFPYYVIPGIGVSPNAFELLELMGFIPSGDPLEFPADSIAVNLQSLLNANLEFLSAEARELYSLTDFYEAAYDPPIVGTRSNGQSASPLLAYGLRTTRTRTDIRRGMKRFAGVSEGDVDSGGIILTAMQGFIADLGALLGANLLGDTSTYRPCVISREKLVDPETGKVTYQLYEDPAEQEEHIMTGFTWQGYTQIRSQTSRQYGRGI